MAAAGPGHPPAPLGTGRPAGEVVRVAGAAEGSRRPGGDRGRRPGGADLGIVKIRASGGLDPASFGVGGAFARVSSPASRAAPSSGSGTACLAASLGIAGRLRWQQDRDKLATGDAAAAGRGRHAPVGQHHGRWIRRYCLGVAAVKHNSPEARAQAACGVLAGPLFVGAFTAIGAKRAGYDWPGQGRDARSAHIPACQQPEPMATISAACPASGRCGRMQQDGHSAVLDVEATTAEDLVRSAEPLWDAMERAGGLVDSWGGGEFCHIFPRVLAFIRDTVRLAGG